MFESVIWAFHIRLHFDLTPSEQKVMIVQSQLAGTVVSYMRPYLESCSSDMAPQIKVKPLIINLMTLIYGPRD